MADRQLLGHADAAVQLHRVLRHEPPRLADADLRHGDVVRALMRIGFIDHHRRQHRHRAALLQRHQHLGQPMLHHLIRADRLAELFARPAVFQCHRVQRLHGADALRRGRRDAGLDHPLDQRQALADLTQHRIGADLHAGQRHLGGTLFVAHRVSAPRHTVRVRIHQEQRDAVGIVALAGCARAHHKRIGAVAMRDDALGAVQHPVRAAFFRGGHHIGDVVAGLSLAMRERQLHAAVGDRRQHARLLRIAGAETHRRAAQYHGRQIRLQDQRAAERLHHQHDLDRAAAEPAVFLGERQTEQAEVGVLRPHRGAPAARRFEVVLTLIERVAVGQQAVDAVLQQALFVGEGEVHLAFPIPFLTS